MLTALVTVLPVLSLLSCTKNDVTPEPGFADTPIRFVATMGETEPSVKGQATITTQTLESFGVFAAFNADGDGSGRLDHSYLMNVPYRLNPANGLFDTSPERYWPVAGKLSFFAMAPYDRLITESMDLEALRNSKDPVIQWGPDPDPALQIDLCVAVSPDQTKQLQVPLEFHHATSQIYFAANYVELEPYQFIIIDEISIANIIGSKEVTIIKNPPYVKWEDDEDLPREAGYVLSRTGGHLNDNRLPISTDEPRGVEISTQAGHLFLIPQTYDATSSKVELKVAYTLYRQDTDSHGPLEVVGHFNMETVMPRCEWKPDTRYRYLLSVFDITREQGGISIQVYEDRRAEYYPMVCYFQWPSDTKTVGREFDLPVQVGPSEVSAPNNEVDWTVNGVSIQDIYDHPDSPDVLALPVLLEYRDATGAPIDPKNVHGTDTHTLKVICRKITETGQPALIKARTRYAATENSHKEAILELTVVGKDGTLGPYPSDDHEWDPVPNAPDANDLETYEGNEFE